MPFTSWGSRRITSPDSPRDPPLLSLRLFPCSQRRSRGDALFLSMDSAPFGALSAFIQVLSIVDFESLVDKSIHLSDPASFFDLLP